MKITFLVFAILCSKLALAQDTPPILAAFARDDSTTLAKVLTENDLTICYGNYSLLSQTIRYNAVKFFNLLTAKGADVNKVCNGYVLPLMHAAKYGRLDMVKILVAKGANVNYKYEGEYQTANGETPLTYAEKYEQTAVVDYLKTVVNKN